MIDVSWYVKSIWLLLYYFNSSRIFDSFFSFDFSLISVVLFISFWIGFGLFFSFLDGDVVLRFWLENVPTFISFTGEAFLATVFVFLALTPTAFFLPQTDDASRQAEASFTTDSSGTLESLFYWRTYGLAIGSEWINLSIWYGDTVKPFDSLW